MSSNRALGSVLAPVRHVLLDFDGPVCSVFAGFPAVDVAAQLRKQLGESGVQLLASWGGEADPLALLRKVADDCPEVVSDADRMLAELEEEAVGSAQPTRGAERFLRACHETGRDVHVVSNNSGQAIRAYIQEHDLSPYIASVFGRTPGDPASMKPSPRLLQEAMAAAGTTPEEAIFIGDAVRDVQAGHAAGVRTIGFANKPPKREKLAAAWAVAVVDALDDISGALWLE